MFSSKAPSGASTLRDAGHLIRLAAVMALLVAGFLVIRQIMAPASFGQYGHFRGDALEEIRSRPIHYAGRTACDGCHASQIEEKLTGKHAKIACEACHGALEKHASDISVKPVLPESGPLCSRCHEALAARPKGFPQVVTLEHAMGNACTVCHKPHAPKI